YDDPVVWSWPNRMLCDHAIHLFLGHHFTNTLVSILHLVCQIIATCLFDLFRHDDQSMHYQLAELLH
ncbi:hypothetical protein H0E87_006791, partial [Populus deltoides]